MDVSALVFACLWIASAFGGRYVATEKRRTPGEGFVFGLVFGPVGMLVEACLPDDGKTAQVREWDRQESEQDELIPSRSLRH